MKVQNGVELDGAAPSTYTRERGWPSWKTEPALLSFEITLTDLASFPILPFGGYDEGGTAFKGPL